MYDKSSQFISCEKNLYKLVLYQDFFSGLVEVLRVGLRSIQYLLQGLADSVVTKGPPEVARTKWSRFSQMEAFLVNIIPDGFLQVLLARGFLHRTVRLSYLDSETRVTPQSAQGVGHLSPKTLIFLPRDYRQNLFGSFLARSLLGGVQPQVKVLPPMVFPVLSIIIALLHTCF